MKPPKTMASKVLQMRSHVWIRRSAWSLVDQAISSSTNFATSIVIAKSVSKEEFGAFAVGFVAYLLVIGAVRSLCFEPLVVRFSSAERPALQQATADALGAGLALSVIGGALLVPIRVLLGPAFDVLWVIALAIPFLACQEGWRHSFTAGAHPKKAAMNDLIWAALQAVLMLAVFLLWQTSLITLVVAWSSAGAVAAIVGAKQSRAVPRPTRVAYWIRTHGDLGRRYLAEFALYSGASQATVASVAAISGLAAAGALRGAHVLFGPLNVMFISAMLVGVAEGARLHERRPQHLQAAMATMTALLCSGAMAWGVAMNMLPAQGGRGLFGQAWALIDPVLVPATFGWVGLAASAGGLAGLRVTRAASRSLSVRMIVVPITVSTGLVGARLWGAVGAAWAVAGGSWLTAVLAWVLFRRVLAGKPAAATGRVASSVGSLTSAV